ncbi:PilZ domain-containing protein [Desulfoplanes sp.]
MHELPRLHLRNACLVPVSITEHPGNRNFPGTVYNFSEGGLYIESGYPIHPSDTLIVRISGDLEQGHPFLQKGVLYLGTVIWTRNLLHSLTADYGLGIRLMMCEWRNNGWSCTA